MNQFNRWDLSYSIKKRINFCLFGVYYDVPVFILFGSFVFLLLHSIPRSPYDRQGVLIIILVRIINELLRSYSPIRWWTGKDTPWMTSEGVWRVSLTFPSRRVRRGPFCRSHEATVAPTGGWPTAGLSRREDPFVLLFTLLTKITLLMFCD